MIRFRVAAPVGLAIIAAGVLISWAYPRVFYLIYVNQGGRLLNSVINSIDHGKQISSVCESSVKINEQQKPVLADAKRKLDKAVNLLPSASQAFLLLGRVECLMGDYENAVHSFESYTRIRPLNEIGIMESSFANESNGDEQTALNQWKAAGLIYADFTDVGDTLRREQRFEESNAWYKRGFAMLGKPLDDFQDLKVVDLFILESFASPDHWLAYPNNTLGIFQASEGILTMAYKNDLDKRDFFTYYSVLGELPISDYKELLIRLKGKTNTYYTIETVIDGERIRPVSYQYLPDNWEVWRIPVSGNVLSNLTISISENNTETNSIEYLALIDWIALR